MYGDGGNAQYLALYNQAMGLGGPSGPQQASALGGYGSGLAAMARSGWIPGAHGATPESFRGTNAYKGPGPSGGPAAPGPMGGASPMGGGMKGPYMGGPDSLGAMPGAMSGSGTATAGGTPNPGMLAQALRSYSGGAPSVGSGAGEYQPGGMGTMGAMPGGPQTLGGMGAGGMSMLPYQIQGSAQDYIGRLMGGAGGQQTLGGMPGLNRQMYPPQASMPGLQNNARRFFQF